MMNFNRYVKTADFLALTPGEKWSTAQSEISLAIADLAVAIDCAQVGASDQSLLPSGALSFDADKKASYILAYVKWMNEYSLILTSYRDELKRLLDLVSRTDVSEIDLSEYYSLKNQANEIVDQSHQKLRTSGWCEDQLK